MSAAPTTFACSRPLVHCRNGTRRLRADCAVRCHVATGLLQATADLRAHSVVETEAGTLHIMPLEAQYIQGAGELLSRTFSASIDQPLYYKYFLRQIVAYLKEHILLTQQCVIYIALLIPTSPGNDAAAHSPNPSAASHEPNVTRATSDSRSQGDMDAEGPAGTGSTDAGSRTEGGGDTCSTAQQEPIMVGVAEVSFASVTRSTLLTLNPPSDSTYLCNMAVHDGYRRRGIAGHMLKALEACALSRRGPSDTVYLHLRLRDKPAGALYRSHGYEVVQTDWPAIAWLGRDRKHLMAKKLQALPLEAQ